MSPQMKIASPKIMGRGSSYIALCLYYLPFMLIHYNYELKWIKALKQYVGFSCLLIQVQYL